MASSVPSRVLLGVALLSGSLLMTELSLTRIFSVTMYYHFAFLAISNALFGLSASQAGVRLLAATQPQLIAWTCGMNGALSVLRATLAVFILMNWGFSVTLLCGAALYAGAGELIRSSPPMYARSAAGIVTEPSRS